MPCFSPSASRDDRVDGVVTGACCRACASLASSAQVAQTVMPITSPPRIFSQRRRRAIRQRAGVLAAEQASARFILDDMVEDVRDRLDFMRAEPARSLIIGDRGGELAAHLPGEVVQPDALSFDEEAPFAFEPFEFITSLSSLDTVNDLPGALIHIRNALAPGGLMIASFVASGSLPALRQALLAADGERPAARMHPMVDNRAGAELMKRCGFSRQVVDSRALTVRYRALDQLVADLRAQGLTNALHSSPPPLSKSSWKVAKEAFAAQADGDGKVTERFEIITLTGWKT